MHFIYYSLTSDGIRDVQVSSRRVVDNGLTTSDHLYSHLSDRQRNLEFTNASSDGECIRRASTFQDHCGGASRVHNSPHRVLESVYILDQGQFRLDEDNQPQSSPTQWAFRGSPQTQ